jgi:hypothetical protein
VDIPETDHGRRDPQTGLWVAGAGQRPAECSPQVVVLAFEPLDAGELVGAPDVSLAQFGQRHAPVAMTVA